MANKLLLIQAHKELERASALLCQESVTRSTLTEARGCGERFIRDILRLENELSGTEVNRSELKRIETV